MTSAFRPHTPEELLALDARIGVELAQMAAESSIIGDVQRGEAGLKQWYLRLLGDEREFFSILFTVEQRSLLIESYFMPAPAENRDQVFTYLLRRAKRLHGMGFVIGADQGVYLQGHIDNDRVTAEALDQAIGTVYLTTEECFVPAMRLGFASRFRP